MIRMTAIVSSMVLRLLRAPSGAVPGRLSNAYATSPSVRMNSRFVVGVVVVAALCGTAELARAQAEVHQPVTTSGKSATSKVAAFLGGGAAALAAHESGHLLF